MTVGYYYNINTSSDRSDICHGAARQQKVRYVTKQK